MTSRFLVAVIALLAAGYIAARVHRFLAAQWFLVRVWRFLTGEAHHGKPVTDAGWLRPGRNALTRTGYAAPWWYRPRLIRTLHRSGAVLFVFLALASFLVSPQGTELQLLVLALFSLWLSTLGAVRKGRERKHRKTWLYPLHLAAHELAGHPRAIAAKSWITAELDEAGAVKGAQLALPQGWPADEKDKQRLVTVASAKLGIESAEPSWRLAGPAPLLTLRHSPPPPGHVRLADLLEEMAKCRDDELLIGVGKNGDLVRASLGTDSPHIAISMGTGAGKSNLAGFLLLQMLIRGSIGLLLDAKKGLSYPWLLKDEHGKLAQLPPVGYARTTAELHAAMSWMTTELDRRGGVAFAGMDTRGKVHANVGPRLFTIAEELNLAIPRLRAHWQEIRGPGDPAKSPAFTGLGEDAFAGRQVRKHLVLVGQMLTAEATGSRDSSVKENCGIKLLARYGQKGWRIMADDVPMPPSPSVLGRVQVVTGQRVREAQVPEMDPVEARAMVLAGDMAVLPYDMPCKPRQLVTVSGARELDSAPDLRAETVPVSPPPGRVTLSEAVRKGILHPATTVPALRMARFRDRDGFPRRAGLRGAEHEYDAAELVAYDLARRS
jgi:hypothetical protein